MKLRYVLMIFGAIIVSTRTIAQVCSIGSSSKNLFILDGHNHQGFPNFNDDSICFEMMNLKKKGYDAIVFQLPKDRSKRNH
ncbi:MAG: hypothetical protein KKA81_03770 [Bacteroidetes bacterium]|nr:hypothetical protein [Bacteroidota bacterium]